MVLDVNISDFTDIIKKILFEIKKIEAVLEKCTVQAKIDEQG